MTVEDVSRLMEDSAEAQAQQERMHDALSASLTPEQDESARADLAALEAASQQEEVRLSTIYTQLPHASLPHQPHSVLQWPTRCMGSTRRPGRL